MDGIVPKTTIVHRKRLVKFHVHVVLRNKCEILHAHARMISEKAHTDGQCENAGGDLCRRLDSDRSDQPNLSRDRRVVHGTDFGTVGVRYRFNRRFFSAKVRHGWPIIE